MTAPPDACATAELNRLLAEAIAAYAAWIEAVEAVQRAEAAAHDADQRKTHALAEVMRSAPEGGNRWDLYSHVRRAAREEAGGWPRVSRNLRW